MQPLFLALGGAYHPVFRRGEIGVRLAEATSFLSVYRVQGGTRIGD